MSDFVPNAFAHELLGMLLIVGTGISMWLLVARARRAGGKPHWSAFAAMPIVLAIGLWGTVYNLTWQAGLPDIIYAKDGSYEWGSGFADYEPANPCVSMATIQSRGMHLAAIGYVVDQSYGGDAWTAQIGTRGKVPVYRGDEWDIVVVPRPGCYVVYTGMG